MRCLKHMFLLLLSCASIPLAAQQAVPVEVVYPTQSKAAQTLSLSGSFIAEKHSKLSPRVDGLVSEVLVDIGDTVKQNSLLLTLDKAMISHQIKQNNALIAQAEAELKEAQRLVSEAERLRKQNHIPESELEKRKSALELKKAELSEAQATKNNSLELQQRHSLYAPFAGVISRKDSEQGEWVSRVDVIFELIDLNSIRLDVMVPQERFASITTNMAVTIHPDTYPNQALTGHIQKIVPVSDNEARAFLVRINTAEHDLTLLPGTSATATFHLQNTAKQSLIIPRDALLLHPDGGVSVFVIEHDKAYRRQVKLGQESAEGINIVDGLTDADQVVIRGNEILHDQQSVIIQ